MSPMLAKGKIFEVLHDPGKFTFQSLLSCCQLEITAPWCSSLMLAAAVTVFQTLRSKVSCWPPQTDPLLTGSNVRCQGLC